VYGAPRRQPCTRDEAAADITVYGAPRRQPCTRDEAAADITVYGAPRRQPCTRDEATADITVYGAVDPASAAGSWENRRLRNIFPPSRVRVLYARHESGLTCIPSTSCPCIPRASSAMAHSGRTRSSRTSRSAGE